MDEKRIQTYAEFWPFYLKEHSHPKTRLLHCIGTLLGIATLVGLVATGHGLWFPLALVPGYAFAWVSHFFIQKNRPATFKYPWWSFISDFRMCWGYLTRKLR